MRIHGRLLWPLVLFGATLIVVLIMPLVFATGTLITDGVPYAIASIKCGNKPIIGRNDFNGRQYYYLPNDSFYNTSSFMQSPPHYYCSEQAAQVAGYARHTPVSQQVQQTKKAQSDSLLAEQSMAASISFQTYTPDYLPAGFKKQGFRYSNINGPATDYQGATMSEEVATGIVFDEVSADKFSNSYLCNGSTCTSFGSDKNGNQIQFSDHVGIYSYGLKIGNTLIRIQTQAKLSNVDALKMINSLRPTTAEERHSLISD